ncbi:hypothetical protein OCS65_12995 [Rhodococcus aetherivorans]|uniref:DUF3987 domain-containing protein n=1 Tax=Rhodococcus aetherivorans TaxID=191292 RepID=A0AA46NYB2_9NOCA|nr:hypothetical protein [Rhodococcus aetherivorans]UYF96599.1 hypothetical protein OCS65_12995 [Rhodococcus aetherivorans]
MTRWAALYLDVDVKEGAFQGLGKAQEFIDRVSELIGTRPSVVIHSGHGLQPLWAIEDGRLDTPDARDRACQLSRRFGRFAANVAEKYSASLDSVSDLARILRVPGTTNWKDTDHPVGAYAERDIGGPLSVERIEEFLDEWCPRIDSDTPALGEMVSSPSDWKFGSGTCAYVAKMVTGWRADRPRNGRHQWLMDRCVRLEAAHRLGCITEADRDAALFSVEEALRHWCQVLDPPRVVQPDEVGGGFRWAVQRVSTMTDTEVRDQLGGHRDDDEESDEVLFEEFWNSRPYLSTIRQFAYARMTSPWGVLGVVFCRALTTIPPNVVLPPLIGSPGSVNLLLALVAPSGYGKGSCEGVAEEVLPVEIHAAPAGSGEGLAHQYAHISRRTLERDRTAVMFTIPEVDTLTALAGRQGSTIMSRLRSAFSGEEIGFSYADPSKRLLIGKHNYRLTMVVGVQPEKAGPLIDDAPGGTPQRFLWMPATDSTISEDTPEQPAPLSILPELLRDDRQRYVVEVPECAVRMIKTAHVARQRGESDALDGHALFVREKVAFALAVLDGRLNIDEQDWYLSGIVMRKSDQVRNSVLDALATVSARKNEARGRLEAERELVVDKIKTSDAVRRVGQRIIAYLTANGPMTRGAVRKKLPSRDRDHLDDAVAVQIDAGHVVMGEDKKLCLA